MNFSNFSKIEHELNKINSLIVNSNLIVDTKLDSDEHYVSLSVFKIKLNVFKIDNFYKSKSRN